VGGRHDVLGRTVVLHENKDNGGKAQHIKESTLSGNVGGIYGFGILAVNYQMFEMYQLQAETGKWSLNNGQLLPWPLYGLALRGVMLI
jgi:hypothetical protein